MVVVERVKPIAEPAPKHKRIPMWADPGLAPATVPVGPTSTRRPSFR